MSRRFKTSPAYRIFLQLLVKARTDQGVSPEELAGRLSLSPAQIAVYESGKQQIDLVQTMEWCAALGATFSDFMVNLDREITAQLPDLGAAPDQTEGDEGITFLGDEEEPDQFARAAPLPHQVETIQVLFFAPGAAPEVRRIENTLEAKQKLVEGLITTFETGVEGTVGVANDEALLEDMPFNR